MKKIHVIYYALLRQERGMPEESICSSAHTASELYEELRGLHRFKLTQEQLRIAINSKIANWETPLQSGDTVLLIPPVAGG